MEKTDFDTENLTNAVQNENSLWDTTLNANEEDKCQTVIPKLQISPDPYVMLTFLLLKNS